MARRKGSSAARTKKVTAPGSKSPVKKSSRKECTKATTVAPRVVPPIGPPETPSVAPPKVTTETLALVPLKVSKQPTKDIQKKRKGNICEDDKKREESCRLFEEEFFKSFATSEKQLLKFHLKSKESEIVKIIASDNGKSNRLFRNLKLKYAVNETGKKSTLIHPTTGKLQCSYDDLFHVIYNYHTKYNHSEKQIAAFSEMEYHNISGVLLKWFKKSVCVTCKGSFQEGKGRKRTKEQTQVAQDNDAQLLQMIRPYTAAALYDTDSSMNPKFISVGTRFWHASNVNEVISHLFDKDPTPLPNPAGKSLPLCWLNTAVQLVWRLLSKEQWKFLIKYAQNLDIVTVKRHRTPSGGYTKEQKKSPEFRKQKEINKEERTICEFVEVVNDCHTTFMSNRHKNETGDRDPECHLLAETMMFEYGDVTEQQDAFENMISIMAAIESKYPALFKTHQVMHAEETTCFTCGSSGYKRMDVPVDGRFTFEYGRFVTSDSWATIMTSTKFMNAWIRATQKPPRKQRHCGSHNMSVTERNKMSPDWADPKNEYLNAVIIDEVAFEDRMNNEDEYVEFTMQEIVNELNSKSCVQVDRPEKECNVYYREETGEHADLNGLPKKGHDNKDEKRDKNEDDMKEFWEKRLGLDCTCYKNKDPVDCTYIDKIRIVQLRDTLILDMVNCLSRPLPVFDEESQSWQADYSECLQAKVWPKNLNDNVKVEFWNWLTKKNDFKYFQLTGMILKGSSQDVLEGHFMAAVKVGNDKWFHLDDENVQPLQMSGSLDHRNLCYPTVFILKTVPTPVSSTSEDK